MAEKTKDTEVAAESHWPMGHRLNWFILAAVWLAVTASLLSFSPADPPSAFAATTAAGEHSAIQNWCGYYGAIVAYQLYLMLGPGVWVIVASTLAYLAATALGHRVDQLPLRIVGVVLMAVAVSAGMEWLYMTRGVAPAAIAPLPVTPGGLIAAFGVNELLMRFSGFGTFLIIVVFFGVGALFSLDEMLLAVPRWMTSARERVAALDLPKPELAGLLPGGRTAVDEDSSDEKSEKKPRVVPVRRGGKTKEAGPSINEDAGGLGGTDSFEDEELTAEIIDDDAESEQELEAEIVEDETAEVAKDQADESDEKPKFDPEALRAKIAKLPISMAGKDNKKPAPPPRPQDLSGYKFPEADILEDPQGNFSEEMEKLVREQAERLETALQTYNIDGEVVAIDSGPVITLFEVKLAPGTRVNSINSVSADLARELKAQNIRIVPNTAGKSTVGIEVPNLKKETVRMKELMSLGGKSVMEKMKLPMFLGKDASGNPLIADLAKMPHMLIAGTTGSGKSVCMNTIIMSWLFTRRPDEVKLILVDPKMVEMSQFKSIPHLMCPVVTEMARAAAILEWAVTKMDERYELMAEVGVRDIDAYNKLPWEEIKEAMHAETEEEEAKIPKSMPRLVFIIDELADLMMTNKEVEDYIVRIAQKARAVGIHLILATQRPSANVVTGLIKSNMPCRVSFRVNSGMDSRIVLDQKGAELLLGQGDMLFLNPRTNHIDRAQGTFVDDNEIRQTVKFLKEIADQAFEPQLIQLKTGDGDGPGELAADRDELFEDAVNIVLETQRGSVSLLQRRLSIGYSRASRLIEEIAEAGIIGSYKGSQAREVLITLEEWEAMKAQAAELASDAAEAEAEELGESSWDK